VVELLNKKMLEIQVQSKIPLDRSIKTKLKTLKIPIMMKVIMQVLSLEIVVI